MKRDTLLTLFGVFLGGACFLATLMGRMDMAIFFAVVDIHVYLWRKLP